MDLQRNEASALPQNVSQRRLRSILDLGGAQIPRLGLGTWKMKGEDCVESVANAIKLGYRHIDTARAYENESEVGRGLKRGGIARDALFVASKVWWEKANADEVNASAHKMVQALDTDYLDLIYLHWPNPEVPLKETLGALEKLREQGLTKHIGVSNFTPALLGHALELAQITALQVELHPYLAQPELQRICRENDIALVAYCPLARNAVSDDSTLHAIAKRHNASATTVCLSYLLHKQNVVAVPKASSMEHLRENMEALNVTLDDEEIAKIDELNEDRRLIDPEFAPDWQPRVQ